ncbi:MAG: hypothetical protein U1A78_19165 [Polyangia bacterium]
MTDVIHGEMEPADVYRGKAIWLRLGAGSTRPVGFYWYVAELKRWLPIPAASLSKGDIALFVGDPNGVFDLDDSKSPTTWGKGLLDGPKAGWALANGLNGTAQLMDRFPCFPALNNPRDAFAAGWQSRVEGAVLKKQGGESTVALSPLHLPAHTHDVEDLGHKHTVLEPPSGPCYSNDVMPAVNTATSKASSFPPEGARCPVRSDDPSGHSSGELASSIYSLTVDKTGIKIKPSVGGPAGAGTSHNNIPPFCVVCPIQWIGYDAY